MARTNPSKRRTPVKRRKMKRTLRMCRKHPQIRSGAAILHPSNRSHGTSTFLCGAQCILWGHFRCSHMLGDTTAGLVSLLVQVLLLFALRGWEALRLGQGEVWGSQTTHVQHEHHTEDIGAAGMKRVTKLSRSHESHSVVAPYMVLDLLPACSMMSFYVFAI